MKRGILFTAVVAAATLCGCVKDKSYERFEPTRPGYYMFQRVDVALQEEMDDLWPVFAFAGYYAAGSDEVRERIHDAYFYSKRITRTDDVWRIIGEDSELTIDTGGKSLYDDGTQWTYYYTGRDDYADELPTITRTGAEAGPYTLRLPPMPERPADLSGELTLSQSLVHSPPTDTYSVRITVSGKGRVRAENIRVDFKITEPLEYDSAMPVFGQGELTLTTTNDGVTDTAKAYYQLTGNLVEIEYNGHYEYWDIKYGYTFRDE